MLYPAPHANEHTHLLPVFLQTAGERHLQEPRIRPAGAPFYQLFFVLEGEMHLKTPNGESCYPAGTALFLPKDYPTAYRAAGEKLISGWLAFDGMAVEGLLRYFRVSGVQTVPAQPLMDQYLLCVKAVKRGQSHEQLSALLYPLLLAFFSKPDSASSYMIRARAFIDEHAAEDLSVSEIAAAAGISQSLLFRLFEKEGTTPVSYLLSRRVEMAKRRLLEDEETVLQIGQDCGFHDCAYFCKVFRRFVGTTPKEFREKYR